MTFFNRLLVLGLFLTGFTFLSLAQESLSPYFLLDIKKATGTADMDSLKLKVEKIVLKEGFEVLGKYNPGGDPNLWVLVFTDTEIKTLCMKAKDRGMLAAAQRIAIVKTGNSLDLSALNPSYLFTAYLGDQIFTLKSDEKPVISKLDNLYKLIGSQKKPFGGFVDRDELKRYQYMMGMPYFDDPVELKKFSSFADGLSVIRKNLKKLAGNTREVYSIVDEQKKTAVFGIALLDKETGEDHFLSIIGKKHAAAMPYEIILTDKTATMLHGRYRFALYWPELTMGTFTKIMSTPGDVETTLQNLTN